jgi:hypothetical protein
MVFKMRVCIITSFAGRHWNFAKNLIESLQLYASDYDVKAYVDPPFPEAFEVKKDDRLSIISTSHFEHKLAMIKKQEMLMKNDWNLGTHKIKESKQFLWNASRFYNKILAINDAISKNNHDYDRFIWFDSDIALKRELGDLILHMKLESNKALWHMERPQLYTEAGILGFNHQHKHFQELWLGVVKLYEDQQLFELPCWTDCHALDYMIAVTAVKYGKSNIVQNINDRWFDIDITDPANESLIGRYVQHDKGAHKFSMNKNKFTLIEKIRAKLK